VRRRYCVGMGEATHYRIEQRHALTPRQREVLDLIGQGYTNAEIAARLGVSLEGAKHHVSEILSRLGVESREEAAEWWAVNKPGLLKRTARALWPWPALATAAAAGGLALAAFAAARPDAAEEAVSLPEPTAGRVPTCPSAALSYAVSEDRRDNGTGNVYFIVTANAAAAPCRIAGDVNLVPVPARVDEDPRFGVPIDRKFPVDVDTIVQPGGTTVFALEWSNWCASEPVLVWRPMAVSRSGGGWSVPPPFISDAHPSCADSGRPSTLIRRESPPALPGVLRLVERCRAGDISFGLYEEPGWRPGESALLEVRPSGANCSVHGERLTARLYVDGQLAGEASVAIDAYLRATAFRVPFRWAGPCQASEVKLEVTLVLAATTLFPAARPHCAGAPPAHSFRAGW